MTDRKVVEVPVEASDCCDTDVSPTFKQKLVARCVTTYKIRKYEIEAMLVRKVSLFCPYVSYSCYACRIVVIWWKHA